MTLGIGRCSETSNPDLGDSGAQVGNQQTHPQLVYGSAEEILHEQLLPTLNLTRAVCSLM